MGASAFGDKGVSIHHGHIAHALAVVTARGGRGAGALHEPIVLAIV